MRLSQAAVREGMATAAHAAVVSVIDRAQSIAVVATARTSCTAKAAGEGVGEGGLHGRSWMLGKKLMKINKVFGVMLHDPSLSHHTIDPLARGGGHEVRIVESASCFAC